MIRRKRGKAAQEKPENCGCCANKNAGRQQERNASSIDGTGEGKKKREKKNKQVLHAHSGAI